VEEGEDCDGTEGATCEDLGLLETGLACVICQFDASACGPPLGMVLVTGGSFEMGSIDHANAQPIRQVQVDAFWIDETEVTVEAYAACVDDGTCNAPRSSIDCNWMVAGRDAHPVNCVTWLEAYTYCAWVGGGSRRLPTEAEWEKAARGTDARTYPWGDVPDASCSHVVMDDAAAGGAGCGNDSTMPVGSKMLGNSPYGARDMAGNTWEWVADWYSGSYDETETDNPTGPVMGTLRVTRGGSWNGTEPSYFHTTYRNAYASTVSVASVGFRCARTPEMR
jgi:formylglycine-generating enzyme required for sulfatase activity